MGSEYLAGIILDRSNATASQAGTTEEIGAAASLEEHQAEPATAFLPFLEHSAVLLHEQTNAASTQSGRFTAYLAVLLRLEIFL